MTITMSKFKSPFGKATRFKVVFFGGLALLLLGGGWYWSRLQWIGAGYVGIIYNASGGVVNKVYPPQRLFVGPFQQLYTYPTRLQSAIYTQDPGYGEVSTADGVQITTSDTATTTFDVAVFYRVRQDDVFTAFKAFGPISIEDIQRQHIRRAVREAANAIGTQYDVFQLMGEKRAEASEKITEHLQTNMSRKGIHIERAMLLACRPQQDIDAKITSRVNSFTQLTISRLQSQIAEISRETAVVRASAETKAKNLQATTTSGKSLELMELELQEEAIDAWNGQLPRIQPGPNQTIVLGDQALGAIGGGK